MLVFDYIKWKNIADVRKLRFEIYVNWRFQLHCFIYWATFYLHRFSNSAFDPLSTQKKYTMTVYICCCCNAQWPYMARTSWKIMIDVIPCVGQRLTDNQRTLAGITPSRAIRSGSNSIQSTCMKCYATKTRWKSMWRHTFAVVVAFLSSVLMYHIFPSRRTIDRYDEKKITSNRNDSCTWSCFENISMWYISSTHRNRCL